MFYVSFFIGACLASHALVIYERWPNCSFICSRSYCANCHYQLSILDELPLISFLILRGRCHYCQQPIPGELFCFEFLGGLLFSTTNFFALTSIPSVILLFSLLLVAIADYYQKEFDLFFLIPAILTTLFYNQYSQFDLNDWLAFFIMTLVLSFNIFKNRIGLGDLLIYFIISSFFNPTFANLAFFLAAVGVICTFLAEHNNRNYHYPFIPYIIFGLAFVQVFMY